ncbi:hypothetical protein [Streptomyces sp. Ag82_O1-15]|nr:hypothetical protein [Streptomyces sp. Ag82_O1-15]
MEIGIIVALLVILDLNVQLASLRLATAATSADRFMDVFSVYVASPDGTS